MAEQKPTYEQGLDYGGPLAKYSEHKPGETVTGEQGQERTVLHVSDGPGGQLYILEGPDGFPEIVPAAQIKEPGQQK